MCCGRADAWLCHSVRPAPTCHWLGGCGLPGRRIRARGRIATTRGAAITADQRGGRCAMEIERSFDSRPEMRAGLAVLAFADATAFAAWLATKPTGSAGLWLKLAKKG